MPKHMKIDAKRFRIPLPPIEEWAEQLDLQKNLLTDIADGPYELKHPG